MLIAEDSVHKAFVAARRVVVVPKSDLEITSHAVGNLGYAVILDKNLPNTGHVVAHLTYEVIELPEVGKNIILIPVEHILCTMVLDENEEAKDFTRVNVGEKPEWLNQEAAKAMSR